MLEPISADAPCGVDLRYEREFDQLRDLRREDDASLPTGVWQSTLKRANWPDVEKLTTTLLLERSKDLMLSAWLGEAWLHLQALDGLPGSLALIAGLCERFPEHLHPQAEEGDQSWRVIPLEWLVRRYSEILLTRVPLFGTRNSDFEGYTLEVWRRLQIQQVQANDSKNAKTSAETARNEQKKLNDHDPRHAVGILAAQPRQSAVEPATPATTRPLERGLSGRSGPGIAAIAGHPSRAADTGSGVHCHAPTTNRRRLRPWSKPLSPWRHLSNRRRSRRCFVNRRAVKKPIGSYC